MVKTAALSIRVSPELKENLDRRAEEAGLSVASYAERALNAQTMPPQWVLDSPELIHSETHGPMVKLEVARGWPVALLSPEKAQSLGRQLLHAVQVAGRTPPGSRNRTRECTQDIVNIAEGSGTDMAKTKAMKLRVDRFFTELEDFLKDWPNQDASIYVSRLDETLTAASTQMVGTSAEAEMLLERAIDYVAERRRRRSR